MGARLKKPLWFLFFFVAYIVIRGGIEFVESRSSSGYVGVNCDDYLRWHFGILYVQSTYKII